jgi:hypothetical protein
MPEDEMSFVMSIIVDDDGNIMGQSESQGETAAWAMSSVGRGQQEFYREKEQGPITVVSRGTVNGDTMTGTWEIEAMGVSGTWRPSASPPASSTTTNSRSSATRRRGRSDEPVEIDLEGFEARGMEIPVSPGSFGNLASNDSGQLLYVRAGMPGTPPAIKLVDVDRRRARGEDRPRRRGRVRHVGRRQEAHRHGRGRRRDRRRQARAVVRQDPIR